MNKVSLNEKLSDAIDDENLEECIELIKNGADVNLVSRIEDYTAFDLACSYTSEKYIKKLVDYGANIHGTFYRISGVHYAAMNRNIKLIDYFLDLGANINSGSGKCKVIELAWLNQESDGKETVEYLINKGAEFSHEDFWVKDALRKGFDFEEYKIKNSIIKG